MKNCKYIIFQNEDAGEEEYHFTESESETEDIVEPKVSVVYRYSHWAAFVVWLGWKLKLGLRYARLPNQINEWLSYRFRFDVAWNVDDEPSQNEISYFYILPHYIRLRKLLACNQWRWRWKKKNLLSPILNRMRNSHVRLKRQVFR